MTQSTTGLVELKPCPFCSSIPKVAYRGGKWGINCNGGNPSHFLWSYGATEADAIAAWNTRPTDPTIAELVAALADVFADHSKVDSLEWTDRVGSLLTKAGA